MSARVSTPVAAVLAAVLPLACTDTNIYHRTLPPDVPNKVAISGTVCTDDPAQRQFPVRIMFLMDTYGDPQQQRQQAVQAVINRYRASENYSFAVVRFAGEVKQLTDGYTKNQTTLSNALFELGFGSGTCVSGQCRDWWGALSLANSIFSGDLLTTNPGTRSRTRYVFIFVAGGPPDPALSTNDGCNEKCRLVKAVEEMVEFGLDNGAAEVAFHTVQVDNVPGQCQGTAEPRYCNSSTPCPANCSGGETCNLPTRLCENDHSLECSDGNAFCAAAGLGQCTSDWLCDGDHATGCDGDSICAASSAGRCQFLRVCQGAPGQECAADEDCCPRFTCDDPNAAENDRTSQLLSAMAFAGHGSYTRYPLWAKLSFLGLDFDTSESVFVKKAFLVTNENVRVLGGESLPDSDGDGLSDREEICYGELLSGQCRSVDGCQCVADPWSPSNPAGTDTDPTKADTDGDYLNDLLEMQFATLNLDPLRLDLPQACYTLEYPYKNRDSDGLNDCEEKLLGTDPSLFDTDRDGYPDHVEFKGGTNYLKADHLADTDMDGLPNGEELKLHLDPQSNDMRARSGEAYRYEVVDEGLRLVPYVTPNDPVAGIILTDISPRSVSGAWTFYYYPAGTRRADGSVRANPAVAWAEPMGSGPGEEVEITGSGTYIAYAACACVLDCAAPCGPGLWCDPNSGNCLPDPCQTVTCTSTETCDPANGRCHADCTLADCGLGQRCDPLLGKCLTDRCLNVDCPPGFDCDTESGVCTQPPCQNWTCPAGRRLADNQKPPWVTFQVDAGQLPLAGFWCDGVADAPSCQSDDDCPDGSFCRIRKTVSAGLANKNCLSFTVKNITLAETLETQPGYGAGYNNIVLYFAQTPLDNPYAYSIFRAANQTVRFVDGQKIPPVAEIPLGDGDFFPIQEK